jgi:uncharacterized protein
MVARSKPVTPLVEAMQRPDFYPHRPAEVRLLQTHISYVFLAGDEVYKVKKPVRFTFLDFSTLERRRHFCHEEVRLNRRLAADVYRGVVAICAEGDTYRLGGEADAGAVEYAVHMRRLPEERTLDRLLDRDDVTLGMIDAIADRLAAFHHDADASPKVSANGAPDAIWRVLDDNYTNARPFRNVTIAASDDDAIQAFARDFMARNDTLLRRRQARHRIRECHGDLHSEHLCFTDSGLVIFDCIEFNEQFRFCDVASELAFLAMDLDYHRRPQLAARLLARYVDVANDAELLRLAPFYQCYRAYVRGKVDSLKSREAEVGDAEREEAVKSAQRHFALAYRYTWAYRPAVVVICGLSGTGKSAVAEALHERTGYAMINSDVVRKELAGLPPTARAREGYDEGIYAPEHSAATYMTMLERAEQLLASGRGAILDATFQRRSGREGARALAARARVPFLLVECRCDEDEIRRRLQRRAREAHTPSDADWGVYREQRRRFEAFAQADADRLILDTALAPNDLVARIEAALRNL